MPKSRVRDALVGARREGFAWAVLLGRPRGRQGGARGAHSTAPRQGLSSAWPVPSALMAEPMRVPPAVRWTQLGYSEMTLMAVRDAFKRKKLGAHRRGFSAYVAPHDVLVLRLTPLAAPSARRVLARQLDDGWRPWHGQPIYDPHWEDSVTAQPRHTIADF